MPQIPARVGGQGTGTEPQAPFRPSELPLQAQFFLLTHQCLDYVQMSPPPIPSKSEHSFSDQAGPPPTLPRLPVPLPLCFKIKKKEKLSHSPSRITRPVRAALRRCRALLRRAPSPRRVFFPTLWQMVPSLRIAPQMASRSTQSLLPREPYCPFTFCTFRFPQPYLRAHVESRGRRGHQVQ